MCIFDLGNDRKFGSDELFLESKNDTVSDGVGGEDLQVKGLREQVVVEQRRRRGSDLLELLRLVQA